MHLLPTGDPGLDAVLGGGVPTVERAPGFGKNATILFRGPPGSGKTIFGIQLARSLAHALDRGDVVYGCVEILPSELAEQYAATRPKGAGERIIVPPFGGGKMTPPREACIFAATLDLGAAGEEPQNFEPAVKALLDEVQTKGGHPSVLVVDSLSDGYSLGASAPRVLADSLCKLAAERGLVLILLEEIVDRRPSPWSFSVDLVIELGESSGQSEPGHTLRVAKNRFGSADLGVQVFDIRSSEGVRVLPRPAVYVPRQTSEPKGIPANGDAVDQRWNVPELDKLKNWPRFREVVTLVHGHDGIAVLNAASRLGNGPDEEQRSTEVFMTLGPPGPRVRRPSTTILDIGYPYITAHQFIAEARQCVESAINAGKPVRRLFVGNLRLMGRFANPRDILLALETLVLYVRSLGIPTVLFDTTSEGDREPHFIGFADVVIHVTRHPTNAGFRALRGDAMASGVVASWDEKVPSAL